MLIASKIWQTALDAAGLIILAVLGVAVLFTAGRFY